MLKGRNEEKREQEREDRQDEFCEGTGSERDAFAGTRKATNDDAISKAEVNVVSDESVVR